MRKNLFSWIDRVLRPKTTREVEKYTQTVDRVVEEVASGAARESAANERFEQQTADYTEKIAAARRLILVPDDGAHEVPVVEPEPPDGGAT